MKIAIIGTGGVGGFFGGKLAKASFDVTFLARGEHLKAIQQSGLIVKSVEGNFTIDDVKVTDSIKTIGLSDLIILGVKAWQVKEIALDLKEIIKKETMILPLQNGVLATEELMECIDKVNIINGLCRIFAKIESPGVINHFGFEPSIVFGELDDSKTARINAIKAIFDKAEIKSRISDDIIADLWKKFIGICVGGLMAVTKTTYGELREFKETRQLMDELLTEIFKLSQKAGVDIEPDFVQKITALIDSVPYNSTASLTRDVWEGKPSEIEYQNGTVVKLAEKYGMEVPLNRFVYYSVLAMEKKARK